jgi:hypothetical protein
VAGRGARVAGVGCGYEWIFFPKEDVLVILDGVVGGRDRLTITFIICSEFRLENPTHSTFSEEHINLFL